MSLQSFKIFIEVVPPAGPNIQPLLSALKSLGHLSLNGFSVATNPVAKPRMSALVACSLIQQHTGRAATLHCTTRDHNRLSLQGLLWGARAMGLKSVLIASGDRIALGDRATTSAVEDLDVYELIAMARDAGLHTGVVFDHHPEINGVETAVQRLCRKVASGAQYAVTQPVYNQADVEMIYRATRDAGVPVTLGILPLRTPKHAEFLHHKVAGIRVPSEVRKRMGGSSDPIAEGVAISREIFTLAKTQFSGVCLMPPFDHYEVLANILN